LYYPFLLRLYSLGRERANSEANSQILWGNNNSLPGALGMYGLSIGVSHINTSLPTPVNALLSGLNAATVGIIALAAVQLAQKAITDKLTRILVFAGGTAGMLYNALWYFPVLMAAAGAVTVLWDARKEEWWRRRDVEDAAAVAGDAEMREVEPAVPPRTSRTSRRSDSATGSLRRVGATADISEQSPAHPPTPLTTATASTPPPTSLVFSWKFGLAAIAFFFLTFIPIMALRGVLRGTNAQSFKLFANFYLAGMFCFSPPLYFHGASSRFTDDIGWKLTTIGTIIFGGGPVVIPLLRE
jgi:chromate transport protein ChrA